MRYKKSTYSEHSWFLIRVNLPTNVVLIYISLISHYNAIIILYLLCLYVEIIDIPYVIDNR